MNRIVHCVASLTPQSGGIGRVVRDLTDVLSEEKNLGKIVLLSQNRTGGGVIEKKPESSVEQRLGVSRSGIVLSAGWPLKRLLDVTIAEGKVDLLHDHGIWLPCNHHVAKAAKRHNIPLLIHPHGMLEPWALDYRARKKRFALWLYQRRNLEAAEIFFATAPQEAESIRRLGFKQPIAVIPNGVELPVLEHNRDENPLSSSLDSPRNIVFMSRIHPKKGLLNLIEAWGRLRPEHWHLRLAGPDEEGHLAEVMQQVRALGLEPSVEYVGEVEGPTKAALLASADLFVLPTFSENFGVVVTEALTYGVPVITTHGAPWEGLQQHGCGWWIEPTVDALTETLREALGKSSTSLQAMGNRGRTYAKEFDWAHIAQQTADVYKWVLDQGPMPDCVVVE